MQSIIKCNALDHAVEKKRTSDNLKTMVNDRIMQYIFIPALSIAITAFAFLSGQKEFTTIQCLLYFSFFALLSYFSFYIIGINVRKARKKAGSFPGKIFWILLINPVIAGIITAAGILSWQLIILKEFLPVVILYCAAISIVLAILYLLLDEIIFLNNEKLINEKVVQHLDKELLDAEVNLLKNELDPHFVYNTLMPLYYLVKTDRSTAEQFACKLIQVYQYFLENRSNDFISLKEELEFIDNYLFLLRIRYKESISISFAHTDSVQWQMILPFSLQLLIENAIKHNHFDQENPLKIKIAAEKGYLAVSNQINYKKDIIYSTRIGLKNLRTRYKLLCKQNIIVTEQKDDFIVKLPLNQSLKMNDHHYYNRRRSN